jgi:hypothetical protein
MSITIYSNVLSRSVNIKWSTDQGTICINYHERDTRVINYDKWSTELSILIAIVKTKLFVYEHLATPTFYRSGLRLIET